MLSEASPLFRLGSSDLLWSKFNTESDVSLGLDVVQH